MNRTSFLCGNRNEHHNTELIVDIPHHIHELVGLALPYL